MPPEITEISQAYHIRLRRDLPLVPPFIVFATSSASIVIETNIGPVPICSARTGAKVVIAEGGQHQCKCASLRQPTASNYGWIYRYLDDWYGRMRGPFVLVGD